jgi:hypothetical protein
MAALVAIDAPRLSESLWNDEIWSLQDSVHGSWGRELGARDLDETLTEIYWEPVRWERTLWRYETTNHHFLLNLMARAGLGVWQRATGAEEWEFDEAALRFLPFLCALGGLMAWAVFFRRLGFWQAAMIVPWALALHPWYQQHATGMRGYPLVFLFFPLTLLSALGVLRSGGWRSWSAYAAAQFLFIYSWPAGAVVMVAFNLCFALAIWRNARDPAIPPGQLKRWAIANLGTVMVLLPLVAPGFFQIGSYLQEAVLQHPMGFPWLKNLACFFFTGCPWPDVDGYSTRSGLHVTGEMLWREHPLLFTTLAVAALGALALGVVVMFRRVPLAAGLLVVGTLSGPVLSYANATIGTPGEDVFIYQWYFIFLLPFLCGVTAIGVWDAASWLAGAVKIGTGLVARHLAPVCLVLALLAGYAILVLPRTLALLKSSVDPRRESVEAMRGDLDLTDPANSRLLTAHIFRTALAYDPRGWRVQTASNDGLPDGSPPGLTQLMHLADTRDLTLYVNVGLPSEARKEYPEAMALVDESGFFELHSRHFGLEPQFERAVYRYTGGLFKFDFSRPKP